MSLANDNLKFVIAFQEETLKLGLYRGKVDGHAGPLTMEALIKLITKDDSMKSDYGAELLAHAKKDLGIQEVSGPSSHQRILYMITSTASWLDPDDSKTAWCGCACSTWVRETRGTPPKEAYRAREWINFGIPVNSMKEIRPGDIIVFQNHVCIFSSWYDEEQRIANCLGGNQSNRVNIARYDLGKTDFLGARRPVK